MPPQAPGDDQQMRAESQLASDAGTAQQQSPKPVFISRRGSSGTLPSPTSSDRHRTEVEANRKRKGSIPSLTLFDEDEGTTTVATLDGTSSTTTTTDAAPTAQASPEAREQENSKRRRVEE
jgi:hypothetical protein